MSVKWLKMVPRRDLLCQYKDTSPAEKKLCSAGVG